MERFIILVIWVIGTAIMRNANNKSNQGKTRKRTPQPKRKNVFGTFMEEIEKEMRNEKEKQRLGQSAQRSRPGRPSQPSMVSDLPPRPAPSMVSDPKPTTPSKPVGLDLDLIGGDEEIGGINEAGISIGSKSKHIDLDLKRDILKGIIYSEILSEPKSLRNMKKRI